MIDLDADDCKDQHYHEQCRKPPVRDFGIMPHEFHVDVIRFSSKVEDSAVDPWAMVEKGMNEQGRGKSKGEHKSHGERDGKVDWGILGICSGIQLDVGREDVENIVFVAESVCGLYKAHRQIRGLPYLPRLASYFSQKTHVVVIENRNNDPVEQDETDPNVNSGPPRSGEG